MQREGDKSNSRSAKHQRQRARDLGERAGDFQDDFLDDKFLENAEDVVRKSEHNYKKAVKVQNQVNYFGYHIEPFNMKNEREEREIDQDGNFLFSKKREQQDKSDTWLDQLDEEEAFAKVYMQRKREKGVYSDDEDDEPEGDEDMGDVMKKKLKQNPKSEAPGKYDGFDKVELLSALCSMLDNEATLSYEIDITPSTLMHRLKKQQVQSEKPVFAFKKNMRQKEREEQEKKIAEWESTRLSEEQLNGLKADLADLIDVVKEIEVAFQLSSLWDKPIDQIKAMHQKEQAKKAAEEAKGSVMECDAEEGDEDDEMAEEEDLKMVPKELLDKLNAGTITEEEAEEIKRFVMMARMRRKRQEQSKADKEDSDSDDIVVGNIQFDSDDDDDDNEAKASEQKSENVDDKTTQQPQFRRPISEQKPPAQAIPSRDRPLTDAAPLAFKAPAPFKKPVDVKMSSEIAAIVNLAKISAPTIVQEEEENEIPASKPKPAPIQNTEDDIDMFG